MWKVLGVETVIPAIAGVWKERMLELSKKRKDGKRFQEMISKAEVRYIFDPAKEVSTFVVNLPEKYGHEDLDFLKTFVNNIYKSISYPVVEYDGVAQLYTVIFTTEKEEDGYAFRRKHRKEILDIMERSAQELKKEKE